MQKCSSQSSEMKDETSILTNNNLPQIESKLSLELQDDTGNFKLSNQKLVTFKGNLVERQILSGSYNGSLIEIESKKDQVT